MKKDIKLTYLKKASKFLDKHRSVLTIKLENDEVIIEAIITDIGFRGDIYK